MPTEKATAIVLRTVEFSETSLVVTLFTREFGKLGALAKGARRPKNPFESALDLLAICRIVFLHKASDALDLVTEAKLLRRFRLVGRDLFGLYAGYYVAELLGELTDEDDPHPELFDLADETLEALAAGDAVPRRIVRFELGGLRLLGHLPALQTGRMRHAGGQHRPGRLRPGRGRRVMSQVPRRKTTGDCDQRGRAADDGPTGRPAKPKLAPPGDRSPQPGRTPRRTEPLLAEPGRPKTSHAPIPRHPVEHLRPRGAARRPA